MIFKNKPSYWCVNDEMWNNNKENQANKIWRNVDLAYMKNTYIYIYILLVQGTKGKKIMKENWTEKE